MMIRISPFMHAFHIVPLLLSLLLGSRQSCLSSRHLLYYPLPFAAVPVALDGLYLHLDLRLRGFPLRM